MKVTIYSTPTCPYCKQTKAFYDENNVEYTDVDVSSDEDKAKEMIDKSGQMGVPVSVIEKDGHEEIVIGFDEKKLREILGL